MFPCRNEPLYKHITIEERENLLRLLSEGKKIRKIEGKIGRAASTISRKLKRNKKQKEKYSPSKAEFRYYQRRKRVLIKK